MVVEPTDQEQDTLLSQDVARVLRDVKFVLDHHSLGHVVQDLVRVDKLGLFFQVEDHRQDCLLETVFKLEVS